jgi:hypothetical protein
LQLFNVISVPPFSAILVETWNAPSHRYFVAYRALGNFRHVLGLPVVDEFATFSTPIFFGPISLLGELYNVGITLGHQRNPEMPIDQGWPPICVGIESNQKPSAGWQDQLMTTIKESKTQQPGPETIIQRHQIGSRDVLATNAPLLPRQLQRLCQVSSSPLCIAFSTGNRITAQKGKVLSVQAASEATLNILFNKFSTPTSGS